MRPSRKENLNPKRIMDPIPEGEGGGDSGRQKV